MSAAYGEREAAFATTGEARARVSWSAIFSGVVLVVAVQVLLSVLGAGVGLGMISPGQANGATASGLGTGAGIWWLVSTILSLIAGSYVAARMAGVGTRFDGVLHGMVVWGLTLLLTVYLITSAAGGLIGGAFTAVSSTMSAAGSALGGAASTLGEGVKASAPQLAQAAGFNPDLLKQQTESLLSSPTPQDPASMSAADATKAVGQAMPDLVSGGAKADAAKQRIVAIVAAQAKISPDEAQKRVDNAQAQFEQTKQQAIASAKRAADQTAAAASQASFLAFVGLLIGAAAAAVGGAIASPRPYVTGGTGRFR
jgi:hypothetical protein